MTAMAQAAESSAMVLRHPNGNGGELSRIADDGLMPLLTTDQLIQRYNAVVALVTRVMKRDIHYGTIPGTERKNRDGTPTNKSDTLYKAGAEMLCTLFGLVPEFEDYRVVEDWEKGIFYYAYRCKLHRRGQVFGEGIGSANSREKKYRRGARACPECGAPTIKKSKYPPKNTPDAEPGWYCHAKDGGCGRSFEADDERILNQAMTVDPAEAADQINTLQKMAQKRALVAATLIAANASEFFTQDVEDMQFIDAEWSDSKQPVPKGRHIVDPELGEVIDAEPQQRPPQQQKPQGPDLSNDDVFKAEWTKAAAARGFTESGAVALLDNKLASKNLKLPALSLKNRQALGQKMLAGDYDCLRDEFNKLGAAEAAKGGAGPLASEEQVREIKNLLELVRLPEGMADKWFAKAGVDMWEDMPADQLAECINYVRARLPQTSASEQTKPAKPQSPADVGVDPDELKDWDEFRRQYSGAAATQVDEATAAKGLDLALVGTGKRGKPETTSLQFRVDTLTAVLAGAFDFATGRVNKAKLALDAPAGAR